MSTKDPENVSRSVIDPLASNRRDFIKQVLTAGAVASMAPVLEGAQTSWGCPPDFNNPVLGDPNARRKAAYNVRVRAALEEYERPVPPHPDNGDEERFSDRRYIGSYTKGLPHNKLGEVDPLAYHVYLHALQTGVFNDYEQIPLGCTDPGEMQMKLVNPLSGLAYVLEGVDSHATFQPPPPCFGSPEENAEIIELYWMALTRDVPFTEYDTNPLTRAAAADLTQLGSAFKGPKENGVVTTRTLFRDDLPGALIGPYQSQFRYLPVMYGTNRIEQRIETVLPGQDFLTDYPEWLRLQRGCFPAIMPGLDHVRRYIRNGRDAAWWVRMDLLHQAHYMAMLILLFPMFTDVEGGLTGLISAPLSPDNPYNESETQTGFATFGVPHIATLVPEVTTRALKAVWFQKWYVHRRLRPEEYAGRIHNTLTGNTDYPIGKYRLLDSTVLRRIQRRYGTYLLPQAFPEGAPLHPSYGAGHATVVGACATVAKAFFDENFVISNPVVPAPDGRSLVPYTGPDADQLTVGGELNKLASNVATGRNIAGVHWRSDAIESLKLGEDVAISILRDQKKTFYEYIKGPFRGFTFTKFDGTTITV